LTQGLLTFSRSRVLSPKVLDLNALLTEQFKMLRRLVPESIDLKFVAGSGAQQIKADSGQIEQLIMNLVINARDATADGGLISIETKNVDSVRSDRQVETSSVNGAYVMVAVTDNGSGMDAATKAHSFEPFFTTKAPGKGTGLGLAIVSDIVKQSGGEIFVQSELGRGTTFKIFLPRVHGTIQNESEAMPHVASGATGTILLVEDEDSVRESIAEYLTQEGYSVLNANGPSQALTLASEFGEPIHVILTDVIMPRMSGKELAEKVKKCHPESKVIFMSGYSNNLLTNRQLLDPSYILLQKPLRLSVLANRLREVLTQSSAARTGQ
jgi:two-component system, cell cycle sensor histidine kinase and response regulator CckA